MSMLATAVRFQPIKQTPGPGSHQVQKKSAFLRSSTSSHFQINQALQKRILLNTPKQMMNSDTFKALGLNSTQHSILALHSVRSQGSISNGATPRYHSKNKSSLLGSAEFKKGKLLKDHNRASLGSRGAIYELDRDGAEYTPFDALCSQIQDDADFSRQIIVSKAPTVKNSSKRTLPVAKEKNKHEEEGEVTEGQLRMNLKTQEDNWSDVDEMNSTFFKTMSDFKNRKSKLELDISRKERKIRNSRSLFVSQLHSLSPERNNPGLFNRIDRIKVKVESDFLRNQSSERTPTMASGVARHSYLDFVTLKNGLTAKKLERHSLGPSDFAAGAVRFKEMGFGIQSFNVRTQGTPKRKEKKLSRMSRLSQSQEEPFTLFDYSGVPMRMKIDESPIHQKDKASPSKGPKKPIKKLLLPCKDSLQWALLGGSKSDRSHHSSQESKMREYSKYIHSTFHNKQDYMNENETKETSTLGTTQDEGLEKPRNPTLQALHRQLLARRKNEAQKNKFLKKFISKK